MIAAEILAAGQQRYPTLQVDPVAFAAHLDRLRGRGDDADLTLAFACLQGDAAALALFDRLVLRDVGAWVARIESSAAGVDEIRQLVRDRLLVARNGQPARIGEYLGQGPLGAWVRVASVRVALNRAGPVTTPVELRDAPGLATPDDPELQLLRAKYLDAYQLAVRDAVSALDDSERSLLRLNALDGVSIDRLATMYALHRSTAARRVNAAKQKLLNETYRLLGERLKLGPSELRSLAPLLRSQLQVSLQKLL